MKRLVYSPKAYVFVYSSSDRKVYDVSDWVVSGNVNRRINEPSTAEFVLRNKYERFTSRNGHFPKFVPMDGVSIWLQRVGGRPIQVFTGYLDEVPYMQLYPGNVRFTASCTLKRLQHTYFDPGVPEMTNWFKKYGWAYTPSSGLAIGETDLPLGQQTPDGGFGRLLTGFLTDIAGWQRDTIIVSDLPNALPRMLTTLYNAQLEQAKNSQDRLERIMGSLITVSGAQTTDQNSVPQIETVRRIMEAADEVNLDPTIFTLIALSLTGMDAEYNDNDPQSEGYGAGIYAINPTGAEPGREGQSLYGSYNLNQIKKINNSTKELFRRMREEVLSGNQPVALSRHLSIDDISKLSKVVANVTGKGLYRAQIAFAMDKNKEFAKQLVSAARSTDDGITLVSGSPVQFSEAADASMPGNITWDNVFNADVSRNATQESRSIFDQKYKAKINSNTRLASYYYVALDYGLDFVEIQDGFDSSNSFAVGPGATLRNAPEDTVKRSINNYAQWAGFQDSRFVGSADGENVNIFRNGSRALGVSQSGYDESQYGDIKSNTVVVTVNPNSRRPTYYGSALTNREVIDQTSDQLTAGVITFEDLARFSFGAAFASRFSLSTSSIESFILGGERSIMNDIQTLKFVEEASGGSMRNFMSLPDGRFIAFYPDYFGAFGRQPYWTIKDIEIVNMGIQYSDKPLATHVMVTGSTFSATKEISPFSIAQSAGFVTLESMMKNLDFIAGEGEFGKKFSEQARDFYKHFGARPLRMDQPIIRLPWFELLYATQLFMFQWAKQFSTMCDFTFQPELMAGGRVGFPDHDLEMYVQSVTHNWDYSSGFDTSAELIAPASTDKKTYPGFALSGAISGIGAIGG